MPWLFVSGIDSNEGMTQTLLRHLCSLPLKSDMPEETWGEKLMDVAGVVFSVIASITLFILRLAWWLVSSIFALFFGFVREVADNVHSRMVQIAGGMALLVIVGLLIAFVHQ